MDINSSIRVALRNIATHGDTDIFPFPFENLIFTDKSEESRALLEGIHQDFEASLARYAPETMPTLSQVGYAGFRWATLIDPFWNAYYLAMVISLADQIEAQRIPENERTVFSYRFSWQPDESKLFKDSTWVDFRKRCLELSQSYPIVVQTDIADFYPRIYHHRIDNALRRLPNNGDIPKRIMALLSAFAFSKNVSYGLPIGGPASRILAELALDGVDKLLVGSGIKFCRYADDYAIFCSDKAAAYRALVFLSEKLANEGLTLQKKKTRILTSEEFRKAAQLLDPADMSDKRATDEQKLLQISVRYDPYSPHAEEEYEELKEAVSKIDVISVLGREIAKTTIDSVVAKQAIQAIKVLNPWQQERAVATLLEHDNLVTLGPVFVTVMRVVRDMYSSFSKEFQQRVDMSLCALITNKSPFLSVEVNLAHYLQALAGSRSQRKEEILIRLYTDTPNALIRRLIVLIMARWECSYWLSDVKNRFSAMTSFERRSFILASYVLGDEGRHWRDYMKTSWGPSELLVRDWFSNRFQTNRSIPI